MLGGIQAVVWTDAIQGIVLIGRALACALVLLFSMPEGPVQTFAIAQEHHKFSLGSFAPDFSTSTFWVILIYGLFINLQNYGIDQNYVQLIIRSTSANRGATNLWRRYARPVPAGLRIPESTEH